MDFRDYVRILRKGWPIVLVFLVLGVGAGVGLVLVTPEKYQSNVQIFVSTASAPDTGSSLAQGGNFIQNRVQTYASIATTNKVLDPVINDLKLPYAPGKLAGEITATAPQNKVLVIISVQDRSPQRAAQIADAVGQQLSNVVNTLETTAASNGQSPVKLSPVQSAVIPNSPVSPRKPLYIGIGAAIGLLVGLLLVIVRAALDNTVKGVEDFEKLGVPVLGFVPMDKRTLKAPVAFRADPHSGRSEAYRQLRTNMQFIDVDNPRRIIAITSAMPGEGKTTTSLNVAAALAEAGYRVCLIDADLRRPSVARYLGLVQDVGFTTVLINDASIEDVLQNAGRNLAVMTSGQIPPNPSELLISEHARAIVADIASKVDFTIIDTPPLLPVTDGAELAQIADATLVVARAGKTTREQSQRAIDALAKVGERPVGVILNMLTRGRGTGDYQYGYYYGAYRPQKDRSASKASAAAEPAATEEPTATEGDVDVLGDIVETSDSEQVSGVGKS